MTNLELLQSYGLSMKYIGEKQVRNEVSYLYSVASGTLEVSPEQYCIEYTTGKHRIRATFRWREGDFHDIFRFYESQLVEVFARPSKTETLKKFIYMIERRESDISPPL